ncbi:MAG: hypothetical protein DRH17_12295, partial [Deltaproteobacteria bacterium]
MNLAYTITQQTIHTALKIAWRTGKYFKLHPAERAILHLTAKILTQVKSQTLKEILLKIFDKISPKLTLKLKAFMIGLEIVKKRVEQALMFGYKKARSWMKDTNPILSLG